MTIREYAYFDGENYHPLGNNLQTEPTELIAAILEQADAGFKISYRETSMWEELDDYWIEGMRDEL